MLWSAQARGLITFLIGAGMVIHETLLTNGDRPYVLTAALALMGFPFVLGFETKSFKSDNTTEKKGGDS